MEARKFIKVSRDVERFRDYIILRDQRNRQKVIDRLIALRKEYGYVPGKTELFSKIPGGKRLYSNCYVFFYGFKDACKAAGIEDPERERKAILSAKNRDLIIKGLLKLYTKLNRQLGYEDLPKRGRLTAANIRKEFSTLQNALDQLAIPFLNKASQRHTVRKAFTIAEEDYLSELHRLYAVHNKVSYPVLIKYGNISSRLYVERFGSLKNALVKAALPFCKNNRPERRRLIAEVSIIDSHDSVTMQKL
jgi:hypothetical protein